MKQTAFLRYFMTHKRVLNSKNNSTGIIDSRPGCGQPHTALPIAKLK